MLAFNKFDPYNDAPRPPSEQERSAHRRAVLLKWGTIVSTLFTLFGFLVIGYMLFVAER